MVRSRYLLCCLLAALAIGFGMPAYAECAYPKSPAAAPNGDTASKDEMFTAMNALKKYNVDVDEYLGCLEKDAAARIAEVGADSPQAQQVRSVLDKRASAARGELEARAAEFNSQLRAYNRKTAK
jgi:hypothetical protein